MTGRQGVTFGLRIGWLENVQCKKSVFKEKSSAARERPEHLKADKSRLTLNRTEAIRLPALELILWSSY